jgi:outer membrane protein
LLDASNAKDEAFANLNALLGFENQQTYTLVDETAQPPGPPQDSAALVKLAFQSRPDLSAVEEEWQAAERFRRAEHDLQRPTLSTMAVVGDTPIRADQLSPWYGAVGVNLSIPIFNGFQFSARAREADYRADAQRKMIQDLRNRISRDVQVSYLAAQSSYSRIAVTQQLLSQANMALDLAQTRYKLGLGSIVEVSQAQLQQTEAAIGNTNARYGYEAALSSLRFQTGR